MNRTDRIINIMYLAKSDSRDKMLCGLVLNILYQWNEGLELKDIIQLIRDEFHLEPISYEIEQSLKVLDDEGKVNENSNKYTLSKDEFQKVYEITLLNKEREQTRFISFKNIILEFCEIKIEETEIQKLWEVFNSYIYESFFEFGRKAIDLFIPYSLNDINTSSIAQNALKKIDPKFVELFKRLVNVYPNRLNSEELKYLNSLAEKAELFYSLGMEKENYEKLQSLKIENLIVLVDTNFLYSALNLRFHPENSAVTQIANIAKEKTIDLKMVYLNQTFNELKTARQELEDIIPRITFTKSHITSLLNSKLLDSFSRTYYEQKLKDSEVPHPSDKILHAKDILNYLAITPYNHKFPKLDEDKDYLNKKIQEFYDYQRLINDFAEEKGFSRKTKSDKQIDHDVYLREAINELRNKYTSGEDLKFVCLTLDNLLIKFDAYSHRKHGSHKDKTIIPNFILPSIFLKKLRPFIPIVSDDYNKAFVLSITANTFDTDNPHKSKVIQKSMSTFKKLGIDDEKAILNIVKRELFLQEYEESIKNDAEEEFIQSKVDEYLKNLEKEKNMLESQVVETKNEIADIKTNFNEEIITQQNQYENKINELGNSLINKDQLISNLSNRLEIIESTLVKEKEEKWKLEEEIKYKNELNEFLSLMWNTKIKEHRRGLFSAILSLIIICIPIAIGAVLTIFGKETIKEYIPLWLFILIFIAATGIVIYFRTVIINKDLQKASIIYYFKWFFKQKEYDDYKNKLNDEFIEKFKSDKAKIKV